MDVSAAGIYVRRWKECTNYYVKMEGPKCVTLYVWMSAGEEEYQID
jgi:hypothetical protein